MARAVTSLSDLVIPELALQFDGKKRRLGTSMLHRYKSNFATCLKKVSGFSRLSGALTNKFRAGPSYPS